jgi:hypothetical protein
VGEGFSLLEMMEHVVEAVGGDDLCHLLGAAQPGVEEVYVEVSQEERGFIGESV